MPSDAPRPWQVLRRTTVYDSPWVRLRRDDVRLPDGTVIDGHHVVELPRPAVGVVPVGDDGRLLLIEHYRFITDTTGWEIPAGVFDPGEDLNTAAARELMEETGHAADRLEVLGAYYPSHGLSNQTFHVCVARGLRRVSDVIDTNEVMSIRWFDPAAVKEMLRRNAIRDGLSLTGLLWHFSLL
jgi:8-oxo-dGTP pyrophosphatase MutT (NUDIX family)